MSKPLHFTERETEDKRSDWLRTPIYGRTGTSILIPDSRSGALFSQQQYTQGSSFSLPKPWSCGRAGDRYGGFIPSCFLRFSGPSASARETYPQFLLPVSRDSWVLVPAITPESSFPGHQGSSAVFVSGTEVAGPQELSLLNTQLNLYLTQQRLLESPLCVLTKSQMGTNQKLWVASLFL